MASRGNHKDLNPFLPTAAKVQTIPLPGIDKLTRRRGLALPDRGINALYVNASAHSERVSRSKDA